MSSSTLRGLRAAVKPAESLRAFAMTPKAAPSGLRRGAVAAALLPAAGRRAGALAAAAWSRGLAVRAAAAAAPAAAPAVRPAPVKEAHGFELVRQEFVREYDSTVVMYRHKKTGAELMSVLNGDENKTFGVVFRTPVDDSFGIPHILEHSVLCGSRKYPIKEPFVELMKGSLNTFLNAFTYPDRTCYPVASTNLQDFYNLVDVYMDAVFHPKCVTDRRTFEQEGWHYELDAPKGEISYKGVVFNEMKGVYSSPDSIYYRAVQQSLFADNTYRHDSGGDPAQIPGLTYEQFQGFHAKYYHPSNAKFWFYGDDEPTERLRLMDAFLSEYSAAPVTSAVATQALYPSPRQVTEHYAAGAEGSDGEEGGGAAPAAGADAQKAFVGVNWVLTDKALDVETELALGFLDYLMLGTAASPLRKALNDSGLGAALIGGGMDDELKQPTFSVGLKGVAPADAAKVEALVLSKLKELAASGFSASAVEAAVNTIEFSLRENNTGSFPRGLSLMLRAVGAWIYDRDPFQPLVWEAALTSFKARLASGADVFGPLINRYLLDNPHRVTVTLLPDAGLGGRIEAEEAGRLAAARAAMGPAQVDAVVASTAELKHRQETPDAPEALACIPGLKLSDIPRTITKVPTAVSTSGGATLLAHELFTNDVLYLEAALDLKGVPQPLLSLVPLFCRSLTQMGTAKESFVELTERIGRKTGGLSIYPYTSAVRGAAEPLAYVMLRGKAMGGKAGDLLALMTDVLLTARLDDKTRFAQMVAETKAGLEAGIVGSGQSFAAKRLGAQRSLAGHVSEAMGGLSYLEYVRGLAKRVESDWPGVQADLEAIRKALLARPGAVVNMTADGRTLSAAGKHVDAFLAALPGAAAPRAVWAGRAPRVNEALTVPTQVNYVGKAGNLYEDAGYELSGSSYVIDKYLGTTWLWDRVRVVGGAYGGFCSFDPQSGLFSYLSYRDPNLLPTLEAYDGAPGFLRSLELDSDALTKAIIGTIGDVDAYQLPDAKGYAAMSRYLLGVTDDERQQRRDEILGTTQKDFRRFAETLEVLRGDGAARVVAVTSADKAKAVLEERPGFWEVKRVI